MNSAVMPIPGYYSMKQISQQEYAGAVKEAIQARNYMSSIGYPDNVRIIEQLTGHTVPISREETWIKDGDTMLIMKLKYRTDGYKKRNVSLGDFEFFHATYRK